MEIVVTGKHLDIGDSLRTYAEEKIKEVTEKYFVNPIDANVVISKEKKDLFYVDITIHLGSGITLKAGSEATDPYPAFEEANRTIAKRLMRYKDRLKDHGKRESMHDVLASYSVFETEDDNEAEGGNEPAIIAETEVNIQTLAVADAVMRLELSDAPAMMFKNPGTGKMNMVYRRTDGNIGWVDPEIVEEATKKKKTPAKKAPAKKPVAKKPAAKKAPAKKPVAKKAPAKKPVAKKAPVKKAPAKKVVAKKAPAKKPVAKKAVKKTAKRK